MEHKFEVGDRVKYVSGEYRDEVCNPLWGGKSGNIIGTVVSFPDLDDWMRVDWDNGEDNVYKQQDLELVNESKTPWTDRLTKYCEKESKRFQDAFNNVEEETEEEINPDTFYSKSFIQGFSTEPTPDGEPLQSARHNYKPKKTWRNYYSFGRTPKIKL